MLRESISGLATLQLLKKIDWKSVTGDDVVNIASGLGHELPVRSAHAVATVVRAVAQHMQLLSRLSALQVSEVSTSDIDDVLGVVGARVPDSTRAVILQALHKAARPGETMMDALTSGALIRAMGEQNVEVQRLKSDDSFSRCPHCDSLFLNGAATVSSSSEYEYVRCPVCNELYLR